MLITRKIELHISDADAEKRKEQWKFLRMLDSEIYLAANLIVTNQLFNDFYENRLIDKDGNLKNISDEIRKLYKKKDENIEEIKLLKEEQKKKREEAKEFYGTSKQNVTYQLTSRNFSEIPGSIATALNQTIIRTLK